MFLFTYTKLADLNPRMLDKRCNFPFICYIIRNYGFISVFIGVNTTRKEMIPIG